MRRVFISYAHLDGDRTAAKRIYHDLAEAGLSPWMDEVDLKPGEDWARRIAVTIRECDYFLALLSTASLARRGYVQRELRLALDVLDSIPIDERFVIPLRLDECRPLDDRITRLQWLDFFPSHERAMKVLLECLGAPANAGGRLYIDVGVEVPRDIGTWDDERLSAYIRGVLEPEARRQAERDYEGWASYESWKDDGLRSAIAAEAERKLAEAALHHGFLEGWLRYTARGREAT